MVEHRFRIDCAGFRAKPHKKPKKLELTKNGPWRSQLSQNWALLVPGSPWVHSERNTSWENPKTKRTIDKASKTS